LSATAQTRAPDGAGETILVVDDEPYIRTATQRVLEEHGYTVRTAANGREAIEIFRSERIAAVILDLAMPDLDGTATLAALGQVDPMVRIIGASGLPSREFASSVRCFLPKPFTADQLLSTLASAISLYDGS
jgi:DNA-binding NtrC family response regulator